MPLHYVSNQTVPLTVLEARTGRTFGRYNAAHSLQLRPSLLNRRIWFWRPARSAHFNTMKRPLMDFIGARWFGIG